MTVKLGSVEDIDRAIAQGLLPDNVATWTACAHLAKGFRHGQMTEPVDVAPTPDAELEKALALLDANPSIPETQALFDANSSIPVCHIDVTGMSEITIGGNGEILSIVKDGNPVVAVPPVDSSGRN